MTNIFVCRHSNRMDRSDDSKEKEKWLKSKRYIENPWDSPLSELGIKNAKKMADRLMKYTDVTKIKYFYSSPISRCVETCINMINRIYEKTSHKIYIRIEYGLTESLPMQVSIYFKKNKIKYDTPVPIKMNGIKYITKIDKKLYPKELEKKYKDYLDPKFNIAKQSIINYKDMNGGTQELNVERAMKAVKKIIKQNTVIMTHGKIVFWTYQYITQNKPNYNLYENKFAGKNTSVMTGLKINKGKLPGKVIYKPNNK